MADTKENKFIGTIKAIPGKVSKDVKASTKTTKVVVIGGTGLLTVGSFLLGRVTKKAPKAATVSPNAAN